MKKTPNAQSADGQIRRGERRTLNAERSFRRLATDHRSYARSHNYVARHKGISQADKAMHRAVSVLHREAADINSAEAKRLRAMR